jgi:hypothetical protein
MLDVGCWMLGVLSRKQEVSSGSIHITEMYWPLSYIDRNMMYGNINE